MTTCTAQAMPHDVHATPNSRLGAILQALACWWENFRVSRARSATAHILHTLDDRTLGDIGIRRGEIESIVYGDPSHRRQHFSARN